MNVKGEIRLRAVVVVVVVVLTSHLIATHNFLMVGSTL